ncbi:uncharacterized protein LOC125964978 [Orcinus orca]|uniref:uncharacterized protein LOC125964978 n=1 Tax=Orcinus orca TaxID=9733 RepID=UPI002111CD5F|nr:uncharacterized protein LOC125964978 [Orcinus orca]
MVFSQLLRTQGSLLCVTGAVNMGKDTTIFLRGRSNFSVFSGNRHPIPGKRRLSCIFGKKQTAALSFQKKPRSLNYPRIRQPGPIRARSAAAAAARGGWGESSRSLLPSAQGLAGGGKGQSHINPGPLGSAARAGCAFQGRRESPRRERGRGDLQPQLLSSSPSPVYLYPSLSPSSSPYLLGGTERDSGRRLRREPNLVASCLTV